MTDTSAEKSTSSDITQRVSGEVLLLRASSELGKAAQVGVKHAYRSWGVVKTTGARIALLHGAPQDRALYAAIGGGAKKIGGSGIAGGLRRLAVVGAVPVALVGGAVAAYEITIAVEEHRAAKQRARVDAAPVAAAE